MYGISRLSELDLGEGDTQQNLYLIMDADMRYLVIGKNRFSPEVVEHALRSHCADM